MCFNYLLFLSRVLPYVIDLGSANGTYLNNTRSPFVFLSKPMSGIINFLDFSISPESRVRDIMNSRWFYLFKKVMQFCWWHDFCRNLTCWNLATAPGSTCCFMKTVESEEPPSDHVPVQLTINDCHGKDVDDGDVSKIKVLTDLVFKNLEEQSR